MHLPPLIADLALILGVAGFVSLLFHKIRQPVVLGYIVAGAIVGPYTPIPLTVTDVPNVQVLAELGVVFLLFSLGLEFSFHKLASVGGASAIAAVVEVVLMILFGYGTGMVLGWSAADSLFLGGILSVSSTTIIIKALDELNLKTRRFAEIVFGILIVEDLVAILLLAALSTVAVTQTFFSWELLTSGVQLVVVVGSWFILGYFFVPGFVRSVAKYLSNETLTVLSAGMCLLLVWLATSFHYSSALGAFIMGSLFAETRESSRIEHVIQPIKDLFGAVFFVSVGMLVDPKMLWEHIGPVVVVTMVTIVGKIISTSLGSLIAGQPIKRSVQIGFSLAQIGEFSFIIATLGSRLEVTSSFLYPISVAVSVITTFTTPFLIRSSERVAKKLESWMPPKVKHRLAGYSMWAQNPAQSADGKKLVTKRIARLVLNGILVTIIFIGMSQVGVSQFEQWFPDWPAAHFVCWAISLILSAPFVWGMFFAFRSRSHGSSTTGLYPFLNQLGTVFWLGILSSAFVPTALSLFLILVGSGVLFFFFYRRLERSYRWFERRFLSNLKAKEPVGVDNHLERLAPWDLHLTKLVLHQNSSVAGKTIKDCQIRSRYGLNIVALHRGLRVITVPSPTEMLLPGDEILVLGTDEQIDPFKRLLETPSVESPQSDSLSDYELQRVLVAENSAFVGHALRDTGIRETLKGLVLGLERGDFRTINPDPETVIQNGDVLWILVDRLPGY